MAEKTDRDALIEAVLTDLRRQLEAELPPETATLDEIEAAVTRIGGRLRRDLQDQIVQRRSRGPRDNRCACPTCGHLARYHAMVPRLITTCHGELRFARPYYYCPGCRLGFAPLDTALGLDVGSTTAQVREWIAHVAAHLPFAPTGALLARLTGVHVGESTVERVTVAVGSALGQAQRAAATPEQRRHLPPPRHKPQRLYVSMDGIMTPLRDPWKRDGSRGALTCRWGECKTAVLYEARPGENGDAGVVRRAYLATLGDVDTFRPLISTAARQCGYAYAKEKIVLADGAAWIWGLVASQFPEAVEIVDFFHASEHLWTVARAGFGPDPEAMHAWVRARQEELLHDRGEAVLAAIAAWEPRTQAECALQATEYGYFQQNQQRMQYGTFRAKGYHISSGVMEAGCKHVVASRLDQAGMHWRPETAEAVVTLRAALLSSEPPDLRPYLVMAA
jgi:phage baseplate assembly protein W